MNQKILIGVAAVMIVGVVGVAMAAHRHSTVNAKQNAEVTVPVNQLLDEAAKDESNGDKLKAKVAYAKIVSDYPDYDKIEDIQAKLGDLNTGLIFSREETPQTVLYEVKPGDSLGKLSKQYNTTKELIKISNNLKSDVIRVGQKLRIWTGTFNVLVDKSQNVLYLKSGEEILKVYHVSTGKDNITPVGTFKIATKIEKPVWFKTGATPIASESPDNELGSRWMGFDTDPHYGIHGTIHPDAIGQQVTSGCVRLKNSEVEELFNILPVGTQVVIQN